jgi:hypothetical protein
VQDFCQESWVSCGCSCFGQHGEASTWAKGEVSIPGGDGCDRMLWFQEQLSIDLEDPQVLSGWLSSVPAEYLTVTALLDPVGRAHLVGCDSDVKHGVEAVVDLEAFWDVVGRGMGGMVELLFQYLDMLLEGFSKGFVIGGAVMEGVLQCLDLSL